MPGKYCTTGRSTPYSCHIGRYCPEGTSTQVYCKAGFYCPDPSKQIVCPAEHFFGTVFPLFTSTAVVRNEICVFVGHRYSLNLELAPHKIPLASLVGLPCDGS
eukprot:sb/3478246/